MEDCRLKVLHIVAGDLKGGAARGAYWLHSGLRGLKVDSKVFTNSRTTLNDVSVISTSQTKEGILMSMARSYLSNILLLLYPKRMRTIFSTGLFGFDLTKIKEYKEADIIHLHWINLGFINIKHLSKIGKPIIWTMRDMWPMTGGCHVAESISCDQYKTGCGYCVHLRSKKSYDLSRYVLNRKKKYLPKHIRVVGISNWLTAKAKESDIFKDFDIRTIHNNVNTDEFFALEKKSARDFLGLNTEKKIILCGSASLNDPWKGFGKYLDALRDLSKDKYFLCFFGNIDKSAIDGLGFEYKNFGYVNDNISLRVIYSSADVFVAPSLMDAFGKTLAEAMACATPVVCFDATGTKDIVDHKKNGYKAKPFESKDLKNGIEWVLDFQNYDELCKNSREKVLKEFDIKVVAGKYLKLYEEILR